MANQRKLGRTADQRKALLRNQVTNLIWYGRIETTISKAKEVRRIADKMATTRFPPPRKPITTRDSLLPWTS